MLYFQLTVTVPAYTTEQSPYQARFDLISGYVRRVLVGFPAGCCGLVGVRILDRSLQVIPFSIGEFLAWNDYVFDIPVYYPLKEEPYGLTVECYNLDDTFDHTVFIGVWVQSDLEYELEQKAFGFLMSL